MSAIVSFDIRNFSAHVSQLAGGNRNESKKIFDVVGAVFELLDREIKSSDNGYAFKNKTYVIHTGDGFVAVFYGREKCLQGLLVASRVAIAARQIFRRYNKTARQNLDTQFLAPLGYGIGIHLGPVSKFDYRPVYEPGNKSSGIGLLGHAINLAHRVQEATKDHTYPIICTRLVYHEAISGIMKRHRSEFAKRFTRLDRHRLRGMNGPITLYGVDPEIGLHIHPGVVI
jgi:class 3 adenylate cyclase